MNIITLIVGVDTPPYLYAFNTTIRGDVEESIVVALAWMVREGKILEARDIQAILLLPGFNPQAYAYEPESGDTRQAFLESVQQLADSDTHLGEPFYGEPN